MAAAKASGIDGGSWQHGSSADAVRYRGSCVSAAVSTGPTPRVAIVLVNWNGWRDCVACIDSCLALTGARFRIILCDNASSDGSVERIASWARGETPIERDPASPVTLSAPRLPDGIALLDRAAAERGDDGEGAELLIVRTGANLGFAGGNNVGLRWALARGFDHAWLLNNDTVVPADALAALVRCVSADPAVGLAGSTLVEYHAPGTIQAYAAAIDRRTFKGRHLGVGVPLAELSRAEAEDRVQAHETLYPVGASMLVTAAFLREVGLMEERYFLYYEEADWVLRAGARFRVSIARDSLVYHKHGASAGSTPEGTSARSVGFLFRSRLLAARRFAPASLVRVKLGILEEAARGLARGRHGKAIAAARALTGRVRIPGAA